MNMPPPADWGLGSTDYQRLHLACLRHGHAFELPFSTDTHTDTYTHRDLFSVCQNLRYLMGSWNSVGSLEPGVWLTISGDGTINLMAVLDGASGGLCSACPFFVSDVHIFIVGD